MAIATRIRTGITVHSTSIVVLCVVRDGVGFRLSLKRHITYSSSTSTKTVISEDDDVDVVVHPVDVVRDRRHGLLKADLLGRRLARARQRRRGRAGRRPRQRRALQAIPLPRRRSIMRIAPKFLVPASSESHAARLRQAHLQGRLSGYLSNCAPPFPIRRLRLGRILQQEPLANCTKHDGQRGLKAGPLRHFHARSWRDEGVRPRRRSAPIDLRCHVAATGPTPSGGSPARRNSAGFVGETEAWRCRTASASANSR